MRGYFIIIFLFLSFNIWADSSSISQFPHPLVLDENIEEAKLSAFCGVFMEENEVLDVKKLHTQNRTLFQPITKRFFHRGYFKKKNPLWFTYQLKNNSDKMLHYFFEIPYSNIDKLQLFSYQDSVLTEGLITGTSFPFEQREVPYRHFIYELELPPNSLSTYYLRVEKDYDELFLPFKLTAPRIHAHNATHLMLLDGLFYGFWCTILLVAVFVAIWLRLKIYVVYAIMMASTLLFHLGDGGLGFELIWSESFWFQLRARSLASFISQGAFILFIIYFFNTNFKRYPILHPLSWGIFWVYALLTIYTLFFKDAAFLPSNDFFVQVFIINILLLIVVGFGVIIKAAFLKHPGAWWFLSAFIFPVAGCLVLALRNAD
ncbi:MAG: 7TMR-DISM family protein, partial [Flammeovirgaceae bacterium]